MGDEVVLVVGITANNQGKHAVESMSASLPTRCVGVSLGLRKKNSEECATTQRTVSGPAITGAEDGAISPEEARKTETEV